MANPEHLAMLKRSVEAWNKWRRENPEIRPDLSDADLSRMDLSRIDLSGTYFVRANLSGADLIRANLIRTNLNRANLRNAGLNDADLSDADLDDADLTGANLSRAGLRGADLSSADLSHVNLSGAHLNGADLIRANLIRTNLNHANLGGVNFIYARLRDANFADAILNSTSFADTDLSVATGLESVEHFGPSEISISTLYKSGGNIPEAFLRGCGLQDWEIESSKLYRQDLSPGQASEILYKVHELRTNPAIQFHSCFISYSSKNHSFAESLYQKLQDTGVRCWFAPEDIKIGDKFRQRIDEAIRIHDKLLLILSDDSMSSAWVEEEVEAALERERRENRLVLFPVRIDDAIDRSNMAWAASLRRMRHIGDFSKWKDHDSYSKAFERLLRDLKSSS